MISSFLVHGLNVLPHTAFPPRLEVIAGTWEVCFYRHGDGSTPLSPREVEFDTIFNFPDHRVASHGVSTLPLLRMRSRTLYKQTPP